MGIPDITFKADCIRVAEMCYDRLQTKPLRDKDRQTFFEFLAAYFPAELGVQKRHRPDTIHHRLATDLLRVLTHYMVGSKWPEGFVQSFWLDVISRPFLEDVTQEYIDVRNELWRALFSVSLSHSGNRGGCF